MDKFEKIMLTAAVVSTGVSLVLAIGASAIGIINAEFGNSTSLVGEPIVSASLNKGEYTATVYNTISELEYALENGMDKNLLDSQRAYRLLKENGLAIDNVTSELNNILLAMLTTISYNDNQRVILLGNLYGLIKDTDDYISFYWLACEVHKITCPETHILEDSILKCPELMAMLSAPGPHQESYLYDQILGDEEAYLYLKLCSDALNGSSIVSYMNELETMAEVYLSYGPGPINLEANKNLFPCLGTTLEGNERLYEKYFELAVKLHNSLYPEREIIVDDKMDR